MDTKNTHDKRNPYARKISRRDSLKWIGVMSAAVTMPTACSSDIPSGNITSATVSSATSAWPGYKATPIHSSGYGKDPILVAPQAAPWPLTLNDDQLNMVSVLSDLLIPADSGAPSASAVGVPDFINEWVSAPYQSQQQSRSIILPGLEWLNLESVCRFGEKYTFATDSEQLAIIDDIAYDDIKNNDNLARAGIFFSHLRYLVTGAFFSSEEGIKDIGYAGNTPIAGDYPGPTPEALTHLQQLLSELELSL